MSRAVIIGLLLLYGTDAYFSYQDCNPDCIHYRACCTIIEINENYFPSQCTKTQATCEEIASPSVVCLRPDDVPIGGQDIWPAFEAYKARHHHPTSKPNVKPTNCKTWRLTAVIVISVLVLTATQKILSYVIHRIRSRNIESLAPRQENPIYQSLVQDIQDSPE